MWWTLLPGDKVRRKSRVLTIGVVSRGPAAGESRAVSLRDSGQPAREIGKLKGNLVVLPRPESDTDDISEQNAAFQSGCGGLPGGVRL